MKRLVILLLAMPLAANAVPITTPGELVGPMTLIDFEDASGSPNPVTISGVQFSAPTASFFAINTDGFEASTTFPDFVSGIALGIADSDGAAPNFTIQFSSTVAQVGFGLFDANYLNNVISAYDSSGTLLETTAPDALFPPGGTGADYLGFSRATNDISRIEIVAGGDPGLDFLWIDNLAFSATPAAPVSEPGTLALLGLGLAGLGAARRRKKA